MTEHRPADVTERLTDGGVASRSVSDERHQLLADAHRRIALEVLSETTAPMGLLELAHAIASSDVSDDDLEQSSADDVAIVLHHNHLPKLSNAGLVEYDATAQRVVPTPRTIGFVQ